MATYVVTGAFGYSGRFITQRLLDRGHAVRTLTASPDRTHPFGERVAVSPFHFDEPEALRASLAGADVLVNTYWVRFDHGSFTHDLAIGNTRALFEAARSAGVGRVVHVSITNPSADSPLPYFAGKAELERALADTGLPHSVLRPAVLFGRRDILVIDSQPAGSTALTRWAAEHADSLGVTYASELARHRDRIREYDEL